MCHTWKNADGELGGPRECRKACSAAVPCAAGETCQLVPHDGASLYDAELIRACVPDVDSGGCTCSACDEARIGQTYCEGDAVKGCFLAFNEACGVSCAVVVVESCPACETVPGGARCDRSASDGDPCSGRSCSVCPEEGQATCDGNALVSCIRATYPGESCEQICILQATECAEGSMCIEDHSAACSRSD
jgi:hypothetical protein